MSFGFREEYPDKTGHIPLGMSGYVWLPKTLLRSWAKLAEVCYFSDRRASGKNVSKGFGGFAMTRGDDRIIVTCGRNGYDIYSCVHDLTDRGDLIAFVCSREGVTLGEARKRLRSFCGQNPNPFPIRPKEGGYTKPDPEPDRAKVVGLWNAAFWNSQHPYLIGRCIPLEVLADPRFADTFRQDQHGNAVFWHRDRGGMCGYEMRNNQFRSMCAGSLKGLWYSNGINLADRIVVAESPIDCFSHAALFPGDLGYVSFGGFPGKRQLDLLAGLLNKAADRGAVVLIGTDNDPAGDQYAATLSSLSPVAVERIKPVGKDWNVDLMGVAA